MPSLHSSLPSVRPLQATETEPLVRERALRILLVEDCDEDFCYMALVLKQSGPPGRFDLVRASSYGQGLSVALAQPFDLGIFDQNLGDGTGLDLLEALRSMGSELPVILLTGMDSTVLDAAALKAGAADYLSKADLTPTQLERAIRYAWVQATTLAELRKTNRLLDAIVTRLPVTAVRVDADGTILEMRGRGWECLGYHDGDLVGRTLQREIPELRAGLERALKGGEMAFTSAVEREGQRHHFDHYFQFDHERGGGAIGFAVNVTARIQAESERVRQAQLLGSILTNMPVVAGRVDELGRVTEAHGSGLSPAHLKAEALKGRLLAEVLPPLRPRMESVLAGGSTQVSVTGSRAAKPWSVEVALSFDEESRRGAIFFGRDVTDRRLLEQQLLTATDEEQQRIGADLHDGLGQQLTGLACLAAALQERLRRVSPTDAEQAGLISKLANDSIEQSRALARGLCPVQLEQFGFCSAMEDLAYQAQQLHRINCRFVMRGPTPRQDALIDKHLYRVAQEAIHNAVRHGGARFIRISLLSNAQAHRLVVADDGAGFDCSKGPRSESRGLRLMQQRATVIGASLTLASQPGRGTRVAITWTNSNGNPHESTH